VAGDRYARFAGFVRGPGAVLDHLRGRATEVAGHSPLAALSVLALLASMLLQAVTGLFANDAIFSEGPLARFVSSATSELLTSIHKRNQVVLFVLIGLHLAAVLFYEAFRGRRLTRSMISGNRSALDAPAARDDAEVRLRAAILLAVAAALVGYLVRL
jgi:cytochrome b